VSAAMSEHGDQLKQEMGDVAQTAKEQVVELRDTARTKVDDEVDRRRTELGTGARRMADATRDTGQQLRDEGKDLPAMLIERAATGMDRAASYLEQTDAQQMWSDARDLGRRMPWVFVLAGGVVGFAASRIIKAAGNDDWSGNRPQTPSMTDTSQRELGTMRTSGTGTVGTTGVGRTAETSGTPGVTRIPDAPVADETTYEAGRSGVTGS